MRQKRPLAKGRRKGLQVASEGQGDYVFWNGRILSMDPAVGEPQVLVVASGRIAAAGGRELVSRFPHARLVDLRGRTLIPGIIDAHNHLSIAALHPLWADLSNVRTAEELQQALAQQAVRESHAPWIRGANWNEVETGLFPDRKMLDEMGFDRPVIVAHYTLHQCVVNSLALEELGIGRTTPDPPGGMIARDFDGQPSGLLIERAWSEAHARSMEAYRDSDRWAELFRPVPRSFWPRASPAFTTPLAVRRRRRSTSAWRAVARCPFRLSSCPTLPPCSSVRIPRVGKGR